MSQVTVYQKRDFAAVMQQKMTQIESLLPEGMDAARFVRMSLQWLDKSPALAKTTPASFALAVMGAAEMGLQPLLGLVYPIPYGDQTTLQIGYQGMIELSRRSGKVLDIWAEVVLEGDEFEVEYGLHRDLTHKPTAPRDGKGKVVAAYACAKLAGTAEPAFVVLSVEEIEKRRKVGRAGNIWRDWYEEMCKKTAIRALWKMLPKSTEMMVAMETEDKASALPPPRPASKRLTESDTPAPWEFDDGDDPNEPAAVTMEETTEGKPNGGGLV